MEVDIIKYFLFIKNERTLISILSNPDIQMNEYIIQEKLNSHYKEINKENFEIRIDNLLKEVMEEGRNRKDSNKLFQLIQNGNHLILE